MKYACRPYIYPINLVITHWVIRRARIVYDGYKLGAWDILQHDIELELSRRYAIHNNLKIR